MLDLHPGERFSEYLLDELIGRGAFGQVWKARHHVWEEQFVAIKIPTDSLYVRNLRREGVAIHGLRHPNIVRAIGFDPYAVVPYLVMELVDGVSLRQLLDAYPHGLPVQTVERIFRGILQALKSLALQGRPTARRAGFMERLPGVLQTGVSRNRSENTFTDRSGVGIRLSRRHDDAILIRGHHLDGPGEL